MDTIIEEIHSIRENILNECDNNLQKYMDLLKTHETDHQDRIISEIEYHKDFHSNSVGSDNKLKK